jgi:Mg/Co/Ni transporter MgtE
MLRYPPHERLGSLIDEGTEPVHVLSSAADVSRILASYNLVSVPVVDDAGRLVGVVTIDDVLDHILPDDWRSHDDDASTPKRRKTRTRSKAPAGKSPVVKPPVKSAAPKKRKE